VNRTGPDEPPSVTALLGPTNTGKTHRALERMLEHPTGAIGVPLRLLAREVYDKLTTRVGERRVALVTGEEKRVPAGRPSYWVCTVEAMPPDLDVDFLAVDEIQLAEHDQRGHVFTDRLLRARGRVETWFLGAETIRPIIERLIPGARIARLPRLSQLTFAGASGLSAVPPRSAIVTFSVENVFELAERVRVRKGGAAVVLGVLSPRARNAQVAMYQAGEVDYLVATDAIGMGLNLDVRHVAFGALRKFDGREARPLDAAEVAQVAGRAGRHTRDGTFGTINPLELPRELARAVESHRFAPIGSVRWRNAELDFESIEALITSLKRRPDQDVLRLDDQGEDLAALIALAKLPEVRARADEGGPRALELLWDVCRVPDYRKLLFESHVGLLAALFTQLFDRGAIDEAWALRRLAELDRTGDDDDIDGLTARLSGVRTWSYVANQSGWVADPPSWQARTSALEDRLSDALHARLVARFVERRRRSVTLQAGGAGAARGPSVDPAHPFARLAAMRAAMQQGEEAPQPGDPVEAIVDAPPERFTIDERGRIALLGDDPARAPTTLAILARGATLLTPEVRPVGLDALPAGARARVVRRLVAVARDLAEELIGPLRALESAHDPPLSSPARGLVYQLAQSLGSVRARDAAGLIAALTEDDRRRLAASQVHLGARAIFVRNLVRPQALARRAQLVALHFDEHARPRGEGARGDGSFRPSFAIGPRVDPRACAAMGYLAFADRAIRADVVESAYAILIAGRGFDLDRLASRLGAARADAERVAQALIDDA
jgi:ATP-dependent RNA helicase SUPV3L1/SUV3